jgi:hypothetical protein
VDPLMGTIGTGVDIHRNNETREYLEPWARIADKIDGVVLGVVHLRKESRGGDVVSAITGSSAFGEVARSVFGFAKDPKSDCRVMSQVKNSTGPEDLSLAYRIDSEAVTTDAGTDARVGKFVIEGKSDRNVADLLTEQRQNNQVPTAADEASEWLHDYLTLHGRSRSSQVKDDAKEAGHSKAATERAATKKLKVVIESEGFPRVTYWSLPPGGGPGAGPCPEGPEESAEGDCGPGGRCPEEGAGGFIDEQSVPVTSQSPQHTDVEATEVAEVTAETSIRTIFLRLLHLSSYLSCLTHLKLCVLRQQ